MSSSTKFGFRPRALDVSRKLPVRIRKCRKKIPKVKRTVAMAPTGMEKEEEMESHLQQALLAQKATSAGDNVQNHVIPTPRVLSIPEDEYDRIYQQQRRFQKNKKLIVFKDYVPFFLTQGSYNPDSEDEEWLSTRRNINVEDFEHIIEKLETTSQLDIIKPRNARALLQRYDLGLIDDVYDYWLQKRQKAASKKSKCSVLMPKVCTEARRDEKTIINPYIAFRRRLDKVQTRKKQKTELMTYEKMLHINFSMKRSIVLISALAQRERLKKVDCDLALLMFQLQYKKRMSNQALEELIKQQVSSTSAEHKPAEIIPTTSGSQLIKDFELPEDFRHKNSWNSTNNDNLTEDKCLQRNLELWNSAAFITPIYASPSISDNSAEMEKVAAVGQNSKIDGRYQFRRKHGCNYRAPIPISSLLSNTQQILPPHPLSTFDHCPPVPPSRFPRETFQPDGSVVHKVGYLSKRLSRGHGGRITIDLYYPSPNPNSNKWISPKNENKNF